jgi:formylglycine-generating enzyme required for sulfatase activity/TPR repeat protein
MTTKLSIRLINEQGMVVKRFLVLTVLVVVLAINTDVLARGLTVQLRTSEAKNAPVASEVKLYAKSYALVIGIDAYTNGWPRLSNAVKDAKLIATALKKKGFDVTLKTNLKSAELKKAFEEFFVFKGENDEARLFIWYAGHGHTLEDEGYLVPADAPRPDKSETQFKYSALNMRRFGEFVRQANAKHVYNVFDSCFAGTIFNTQRSLPPAAITHATTQPVRQFLTSGDAEQEVSDDGTFRKLFLRALKGQERADANNDGYVTGSEMGMFLTDRMTNISRIRQTPRYGKLNHEDFDRGDFVFKLASLGKVPPVASTPSTMTAEVAFWQSIENSKNAADYRDYLTQFPNGTFAPLARRRASDLEGEKQTASLTPPTVTIDEMDATYVAIKTANLRENPSAKSKKIGQVTIDSGLNVTGKVKGKNWYRVAHGGDTAFVFVPLVKAIDATELEAWRKVKDSKDADEFNEFLKVHPSGHFADRAKRLREVLKPVQVAVVAPPKPTVPSPVKPAIGVYPKRYKIGDTFKDCSNCPEMVVIPAGNFLMGSPSSEPKREDNEGPQHRVAIPQSLAVGKFEITQAEYYAVIGSNPSNFKGNRNPVEKVSWEDAQKFVRKLSALTSKKYRLLSEAEWEYAARAGTTTPFNTGETITSQQASFDWKYTYNGSSRGGYNSRTAVVGTYLPNAFGLYDMHGNVWEWVRDCWNENYDGAPTKGGVWANGDCSRRVLRGGSWNYEPREVRSAHRFGDTASIKDLSNGLRVARELDESDLKASNTNQPKQVAIVVPPVNNTLIKYSAILKGSYTDYDICVGVSYGTSTYIEEARVRALSCVQGIKIAAVKPPKPSVPSPLRPAIGIYPQRYKPGDTFKDCPECPEMVVIPAGSFQMGDLRTESDRKYWVYKNENPNHPVNIPKPFAIGKYEITQAEYYNLMGRNPSELKNDINPVEMVKWDKAKEFTKRLSVKSGKYYRLLSEAEWEYAGRAGTTTRYHCGNSVNCINSVAWHQFNSEGNTHPVGELQANSFGLHDMFGNVHEWVEDCWNETYLGAPKISKAWKAGDCSRRVIRGGSRDNTSRSMHSAVRDGISVENPLSILIGFRVARDLDESDSKASSTNQPKQVAVVVPPKPTVAIDDVNVAVARGKAALVKRQYEDAFKWFSKAAKLGNSFAQVGLGNLFLKGHGVNKSSEEAVKWFRKAAAQEYAAGQHNLGYMYSKGFGVDFNKDEALKWFRKAAKQNYSPAQTSLGDIYFHGKGVWVNYDEALKWFHKAAKQNYRVAQYRIGTMYYHGYSVRSDYDEALKWFRKAAKQNYSAAQNDIGFMYQHGYGVSSNSVEAEKWYRKAIEQGNTRAKLNLAILKSKK